MKNARRLHIRQVQSTLYIKSWKEWLGRMHLSTSHPFTKPHSKKAEPLQNIEILSPMTYELNQTKKQGTHDAIYVTLLPPSAEVEEYGVSFTKLPPDLIRDELKQELKEVPLW